MRTRKPRVLLVDDNASFREALRDHLLEGGLVEVIAMGANGAEALRLVEELRPDVVSMDLEMPVMNGLEATRAIHERHLHTRVVIVSGSSYIGDAEAVAQLPAAAVVTKQRAFAELGDTILRVASAS